MATRISRILVPVDGSAASHAALETALALAATLGARITILEVIEEFGPLPGHYDAAPASVDRVKWVSAQRFDELVPSLIGTEVAWHRRVEEGYPAETICNVAEDEEADLIVMGNRGLGAFGRFLLGSVSDRVVHHAPCSVMVVRAPR